MSAGARRIDSVTPATMARTSTRIVTGRRRAKWTSHTSASGPHAIEEGPEVPGRAREQEQRAPHFDPRDRVVDVRLREDALGVGDVDHGRQTGLEPRDGLLLRRAGRGER